MSHLSESKPLTEAQDLRRELEATQQELLRTQARLHQLQEEGEIAVQSLEVEVQAEGGLEQLRGQYLQVQYELWVMKACVAWMKGERLRLTHCLEASLDCTTLETQAMVADWLKRLDQFAKNSGGAGLELEGLLLSAEWRAMMKRVVADEGTRVKLNG